MASSIRSATSAMFATSLSMCRVSTLCLNLRPRHGARTSGAAVRRGGARMQAHFGTHKDSHRRHIRTLMRNTGTYSCVLAISIIFFSCATLTFWFCVGLLVIWLARSPNRSVLSVSSPLYDDGEQFTMSVVRALPPNEFCGGGRGEGGGGWSSVASGETDAS